MFVLFILHHILNRGWYRALPKGRYSPARVFQLVINLLLLLVMMGQMLCPPASYGGRVLGLCADGASSGAALEHGVRKTWKGSGPLPEFPVENHCGKDCRNCTCGLWTFRIYQQRFTGLYVSSDTVRIYGFQRTGRSILPGLSGHDGIFHFCRPLSFQRNEAGLKRFALYLAYVILFSLASGLLVALII